MARYWRFETLITDDLVGVIAMVESLGVDRESHGFEWEEIWLKSPSKWDQYVISLMDGVDEVPYLKFREITQFSFQLDFLKAWKIHLGIERFWVMRNFILTEAHIELDSADSHAAKEIDRLMSFI